MDESELEDDVRPPYSTELEARNRIAFAYVCAAATDIGRRNGTTRWELAQKILWGGDEPMSGEDWIECERLIIGLENGIDPSGMPVGYEVILYATALGFEIRPTVEDYTTLITEHALEKTP